MDVLFQHGVDHILNFDRFARVVANLGIPGGHHFVKIVKVACGERLFLRQKYLAAGGVATAFQRRQHDAGEVNKAHAGAAITPFPADGGFDTADRRIIVSVLRFDPQLDKFRDDDFIIVKRRHPKAAADDLDAGVKEIVTHSGVITHTEVGLGRTQTSTGLQNGVRQRIHCVHWLTVDEILTANGDVLIQRAACGSFRVRTGADLVYFQQFQPAAVQQFNSVLTIQRLV